MRTSLKIAKTVLLSIPAFLASAYVHAYDAPIPGLSLAVPGSVSGAFFVSPSVLFSEDPRAAAYNPAAAADRELPSFGAAVAAAFPAGAGSGIGGSFTLSGALPTAAGGAYALLDGVFADSSLSGYAAPSGLSAVVGLAKSATDDLAFGASFGAASLGGDRRPAGLYGAFGAELSLPGLASGGTKLSAALLGAGESMAPWDAYDPAISWTPLAALSSNLVEGRRVSVNASALAAAPAFSDLVLAVGASIGLGSALSLDLGWHFRLSETLRYWGGDGPDSYAPRLLPSFGLRFDGSSFLRFGSYGATLGAGFRPVSGSAAVAESSVLLSRGSRDTAGPAVSLGPAAAAFSPRLARDIVLPLRVSDPSPLAAWEARVLDERGEIVLRRGEDAEGPEASSAFSRFFSLKRETKAPDSLVLPLEGASARDGRYRVRVWARDRYGNESRSDELVYTVDGTPPAASAAADGPSLFTPNGDGVRDALLIEQSGSPESVWIGRFMDSSGVAVREFRWTDGVPLDFAWDGEDADGRRVADGVYTYELSSVDEAGNETSVRIASIVVDAAPTPLSLALDSYVLSPDRDGAFETVRLRVDAPVSRGLVGWRIELVSDSGSVFRSWSGETARLAVLPQELVFDGRNLDGDVVPDGVYRFRGSLRYANGNAPAAATDPLVVDTKKPEGRVRAASAAVASDRGDRQFFYHDLSRNASWRGLVLDEEGSVVRELPLPKAGESSAEWNLLDDSGEPVPDGAYRYVAEGRSGSGIVARSAPVSFRVESGGAALSLVADRSLFSPSLARSGIRFLPRLEKRERVVSYSLEIAPGSGGAPVRRFSGLSLPPSSFLWDGLDESNKPVRDGSYRALMKIRYENGGEAESAPVSVAADGTPPEASLDLGAALFSPNGDGSKDTLAIAHRAGGAESWYAEIVDAEGRRVFAREYGAELPASFVWDGKTSNGAAAPDGRYRYRLSGADAAGNETKLESPPFVLDARIPSAVLSSDKFAFSPNGDGFADVVKLRLVPSFSDGLSSLTVAVVDARGAAVKHFADAKSGELSWDGSTDSAARAPDGSYRFVAELAYEKGDLLRAESSPVLLDATAPKIAAEAFPLPFSPDDDGENDLLSFKLSAEDASPIAGWSLSVMDPEDYPVISFSGKTLPAAPLEWDGYDPDGSLVEAAQDYSYVFLVRDQLGNTARSAGVVPVDIFVLRDGDRLKIRVSSITFAPNAASLSADDPAVAERNRKVLDRIAAVLGKFPTYRIRVEGHAVNLSGSEREERTELEPLSLSRAETVLGALAERGIARERLEARGLGGREPIVPHGDAQSRWRNRRVEFILVR